MSLWTRIANVFRAEQTNCEIDEELEAHIAEAIARGRQPEEVRRAFGSALRHREASRDARVLVWMDSLRSDAIFGWRQLIKTKITSAAAILSLALAMGASGRRDFPLSVCSRSMWSQTAGKHRQFGMK
jgi:putative ABC transport system permease protein